MFAVNEETLLDIAKALDIKCENLQEENEKLIKIVEIANRLASASQLLSSGLVRGLNNKLMELDLIVKEYYALIGGLVESNTTSNEEK